MPSMFVSFFPSSRPEPSVARRSGGTSYVDAATKKVASRSGRDDGGLGHASVETVTSLGQAVERAPDNAIAGHHHHRHHGDAQHDTRVVAVGRRVGDVGAEASGLQ